MNAMQVGSKPNETGWLAYEECRKGGAIIVTAHEHSYERTKTLISIENQIIDPTWPDPNNVRLSENTSFVVDQIRVAKVLKPIGARSRVAGSSLIAVRKTNAAPPIIPGRIRGTVIDRSVC